MSSKTMFHANLLALENVVPDRRSSKVDVEVGEAPLDRHENVLLNFRVHHPLQHVGSLRLHLLQVSWPRPVGPVQLTDLETIKNQSRFHQIDGSKTKPTEINFVERKCLQQEELWRSFRASCERIRERWRSRRGLCRSWSNTCATVSWSFPCFSGSSCPWRPATSLTLE
jgi:hypothetical protein